MTELHESESEDIWATQRCLEDSLKREGQLSANLNAAFEKESRASSVLAKGLAWITVRHSVANLEQASREVLYFERLLQTKE